MSPNSCSCSPVPPARGLVPFCMYAADADELILLQLQSCAACAQLGSVLSVRCGCSSSRTPVPPARGLVPFCMYAADADELTLLQLQSCAACAQLGSVLPVRCGCSSSRTPVPPVHCWDFVLPVRCVRCSAQLASVTFHFLPLASYDSSIMPFVNKVEEQDLYFERFGHLINTFAALSRKVSELKCVNPACTDQQLWEDALLWLVRRTESVDDKYTVRKSTCAQGFPNSLCLDCEDDKSLFVFPCGCPGDYKHKAVLCGKEIEVVGEHESMPVCFEV